MINKNIKNYNGDDVRYLWVFPFFCKQLIGFYDSEEFEISLNFLCLNSWKLYGNPINLSSLKISHCFLLNYTKPKITKIVNLSYNFWFCWSMHSNWAAYSLAMALKAGKSPFQKWSVTLWWQGNAERRWKTLLKSVNSSNIARLNPTLFSAQHLYTVCLQPAQVVCYLHWARIERYKKSWANVKAILSYSLHPHTHLTIINKNAARAWLWYCTRSLVALPPVASSGSHIRSRWI
jgi:hypothetical protein